MKIKTLICLLLAIFYVLAASCQDAVQNRKPYASGRFYSDNPTELRAQLQQLFTGAILKKTGDSPLAIIAPTRGIYLAEGLLHRHIIRLTRTGNSNVSLSLDQAIQPPLQVLQFIAKAIMKPFWDGKS